MPLHKNYTHELIVNITYSIFDAFARNLRSCVYKYGTVILYVIQYGIRYAIYSLLSWTTVHYLILNFQDCVESTL